MPITLQLTDDQALEIVSQVSTMLKNRNKQEHNNNKPSRIAFGGAVRKGTRKARVLEELSIYKSGEVFSVGAVYDKLGCVEKKDRSQITSVLTDLRKKGSMKLVRRGTWQAV